MFQEVVDHQELQRYTRALLDVIGRPELADAAARAAKTFQGTGDPVEKLRAAIPATDEYIPSGDEEPSVEPCMSRIPLQSLLQSVLESRLHEHGARDDMLPNSTLLPRVANSIQWLLYPERFKTAEAEWITDIGRAVLEHLARGNHPFNPLPALYEVSDDARVVIVGDWGSGLAPARDVSALMAEEIDNALTQGRQAHVIHLGDVYYSGLPDEVTAHVLAPGMWPVSNEQTHAGVTSWALNGNHDMYGGGYGLFQTLLGDQRFSNQRSPDGRGTSFFHIQSPSWDLVGLDTSWDCNVLSGGQVAALQDPQAEFLARVSDKSERNLMLLSHHPLVSAYDTRPGLGQVLREKLAPMLAAERISAWIWGHEHRCMGFRASAGVSFPRCVGNGGVPVLMDLDAEDPVPAPGIWEERGFFDYRGGRWARFGFSVFDFAGPQIDVRYRDDRGVTTRVEKIT